MFVQLFRALHYGCRDDSDRALFSRTRVKAKATFRKQYEKVRLDCRVHTEHSKKKQGLLLRALYPKEALTWQDDETPTVQPPTVPSDNQPTTQYASEAI